MNNGAVSFSSCAGIPKPARHRHILHHSVHSRANSALQNAQVLISFLLKSFSNKNTILSVKQSCPISSCPFLKWNPRNHSAMKIIKMVANKRQKMVVSCVNNCD